MGKECESGMEGGCANANLQCYVILNCDLPSFSPSILSFLFVCFFFLPSLPSFFKWRNKTISYKFENELEVGQQTLEIPTIGSYMIQETPEIHLESAFSPFLKRHCLSTRESYTNKSLAMSICIKQWISAESACAMHFFYFEK